jgi:hypothetical protein
VSQAQLLSLIGVLFALLATLVGVIFNGLRERIKAIEARDNQAVLLTRIDALTTGLSNLDGRFEQRSKERDKFDYEWRHGEYSNAISAINLMLYPLETKMEIAEKNIESMREWRHMVGDAYLPRAVDAIEGRVTRIESKVFNGHRSDNG